MLTRRSAVARFLGGLAASAVSGAAHAQVQPRFARPALYSAGRGGVSLVIMRNGVILDDHYPNGGGPDVAHDLGSGSKAFAGVMAAQLVRHRLLELDEPVALTIGGWGADPRKSNATVRQLLNLTSAIGVGYVAGEAPPTLTAISAAAQAEPGQLFLFDNAPHQIFAELVRRKLFAAGRGEDPAAYFTQGVLEPIGCAPVTWKRDADGTPWLATGAACTARAWAAFGEFVRRRGVWRARTLVSTRILDEMVQGSPASGLRYGLGWWLASAPSTPAGHPALSISDIWREGAGLPPDVLMAAGEGGQRLFVVPSRRLVIVRQAVASEAQRAAWSDTAFLRLVLAEA
jgi:CubicO group peptidase (beta-lactamase class C family)